MARRRTYRFWGAYGDFYDRLPPLTDDSREVKGALAKLGKGVTLQPISIEGRKVAHSFWGEAWCRNLEAYSDFRNRLPRGRTYLRGGNVLHLAVGPGSVEAVVRGTRVYSISIRIAELSKARWRDITAACAGGIDSLVDLLAGKLSGPVMEVVTRKETGLFPSPREIQMTCSCPDWAALCKHLAAVLYGIGARLDEEPSLLFTLRHVDAGELVAKVASAGAAALRAGGIGLSAAGMVRPGSPREGAPGAAGPAHALELPTAELASLFGIELSDAAPDGPHRARRAGRKAGVRKGRAPARSESSVAPAATGGSAEPVKNPGAPSENPDPERPSRAPSASGATRGGGWRMGSRRPRS